MNWTDHAGSVEEEAGTRRWRAALAGASGYAGGELLRLLSLHPRFEIGNLTAGESTGDRLAAHHPQLAGDPALADVILKPTTTENLADHDVVFLALPHGTSSAIVSGLDGETVVVDCSADHRLTSAEDWTSYYGGEYQGHWTYGLPEFQTARVELKEATRVAVAGCYPTAAIIAIAPAMEAGLIEADVTVVAASGTSGAGRVLRRDLSSAEMMGATRLYGAGGGHRHTPEILQAMRNLGCRSPQLSFTPMIVPMSRGLIATCVAPATEAASARVLRETYESAYAREAFVSVLSEGNWPSTAHVVGSNMVHVQVAFDERAQKIVMVAALDNLVKGTAGNAIQSVNLALDIEETTALPLTGTAP